MIREAPQSAKCPDDELIIKLERCCCSTKEPTVVRVIASLLCCLVHGTLRRSDAQRTLEIALGRDPRTAKSIMKRMAVLNPWIASRMGFSHCDWDSAWSNTMQSVGMLRFDFLIFQFVCITVFKVIPASYAVVMNFMRVVLCRPRVGMSVYEALQYTLHSWRHICPTLSNQIGPDPLNQEAIDHWKRGSVMPQQYDAMTSSLEIRVEQDILSAVHGG